MYMPDWMAIALLGLLLLGFYLWLELGGRRAAPRRQKPKRRPRSPKTSRAKNPNIVIDGTNVMFWRDETAQIATLQMVVNQLRQKGFTPMVFLDASSRHHMGDTSYNEAKFAQSLGLPRTQVTVCPAKTEADAFILEYAQPRKLPVVTNDNFRDRPQAARNVRLIHGHFQGQRPVLKNL
ncbi:MAG: NYN domain-containing protein [Sulfitobacter sp.]